MESTVTLESLSKQVSALQQKVDAFTPGITEARVTELVSSGATGAVKTFAESDEGKKVIGAEASRITMEALASSGTMPAKPAPAPAQPVNSVKDLVAAEKYDEAFAADESIRNEFITVGAYKAYMKAAKDGRVRHSTNVKES